MQPVRVQTKADIREILETAGMRPHRRFGQNFLIDGNLLRKLVERAEIGPADTVLEVGGGTGVLSDLLAAQAGRLIIVELDHRLGPLLVERFADRDHVSVLLMDALSGKHYVAPEVLDTLGAAPPAGGIYTLVANLPYNIATPLIMNLLRARPQVQRMCFTIQKEVADRLVAAPGRKDYGVVSVAVQTVCRVEHVANVPHTAFWPMPKVQSTMLRLDRQAHPFEADAALEAFIDLLKAGFSHRRKTLRYNLARGYSADLVDRLAGHTDLTRRAENLSVPEWTALAKLLTS